MKTTLFNLCLAFLMLLTSCHKEMESVAFENVTESVTLQSVVGDEAFISFTSLDTWNVTTDAAWLSLSPLSGDAGEGQVKVTAVFENNSNQVREAKVKLTSGDEACEISVFQEVGDYVLPEKEEYLIGVEGGVFTIYFETNVDKVIDENIKKVRTRKDNENLYLKILTYGSYQDNIVSIGKLIKKQELFKSKQQIYNFARYLNLNVNKKLSYNQMLKIISKYIYDNRDLYSSKYVIYKRANNEYVVEPNVVKEDLIKSYKSKTREEMQTIAKLLDVDINENEGAEDIRKKIINNIINS